VSTTLSARPGRELAPIFPMLVKQTWANLLSSLRIPAFSVTSLALPIMFFSFFGLPHMNEKFPDGSNAGIYYLCSMAAYSVSSVMVFSFGIGVAVQRGQKTDLLQRATPLPAWVSIAASVFQAMIFALLSLLLLLAFAIVVGGARLEISTLANIVVRLLLGSLPLIALGMAIGYMSGPNAAPAVANLIYLPLSFASGIFIPVFALPDFVQKVAPYLPTYHYGQLAWGAIGHADEPLSKSVLWLAAWLLVLGAIAVRAYTVEQRRKFS
jgi:ABC-2 type transport system permease protein